MKIKKLFTVGIFLILVATLLVSAADYSRSNPQLTQPGLSSVNYNYGTKVQLTPDVGSCEKGKDFLLQVAPFGCTPAVVRSDLLEEQNVPVFCQLAATQVNPLIDVNAINYISFKGKMPEGVSGVGFHPAKAAINTGTTLLNSPILENVGYAVIVLKKQKNESGMPDNVEGTLTANIKYDIKNTFGVGKATYYLPELNQNDWEQKSSQYGFWRNKGHLRAESIGDNSATIGVYGEDAKTKISTMTLTKGKTSSQINLPGFYCLAGAQLRLDSLENPTTRAKFNINGEIVEVAEGEKFLENRCSITDIEKQGLIQEASVRCRSDDQTENFNLRISPRIILDIDGEKKEAEVGDYLYTTSDNERAIYLGYIGTKEGSEKIQDTYVFLMAKPVQTTELSASELKEVSNMDRLTRGSNYGNGIINVYADLLKYEIAGIQSIIKYLDQGKSFGKITYGKDAIIQFQEKKIKIDGFADPVDKPFFEGQIETEVSVDKTFNLLKITTGPDIDDAKVESQIKNALAFLKQEFGEPTYPVEMEFEISKELPETRAGQVDRERWINLDLIGKRFSFKEDRIIQIDYDYYEKYPQIYAHELFHAFYQSPSFLDANPDFVIEGLASYAEYKYKYPSKNDKEIRYIIYEQEEIIENVKGIKNADIRGIDEDIGFSTYDLTTRLYAYAISGHYFFGQNLDKQKIRVILDQGRKLGADQKSFEDLRKIYGLGTFTNPTITAKIISGFAVEEENLGKIVFPKDEETYAPTELTYFQANLEGFTDCSYEIVNWKDNVMTRVIDKTTINCNNGKIILGGEILKAGKYTLQIRYKGSSTYSDKNIDFTIDPDKKVSIEDAKEITEKASQEIDPTKIKQNYDSAMADYRTIIDSFPNTKETDNLEDDQILGLDGTSVKPGSEEIIPPETFGEKTFLNAILLAKTTEQKKTMLSLCKEFKEKFPVSKTKIPECDDEYKNSNQEFTTQSVLINNIVKTISFEGIYEPSLEEFSAVVKVKDLDGKIKTYELTKDTINDLSPKTNEFIQLRDLTADKATIRINVIPKSLSSQITQPIKSQDYKLEKNKGVGVGGYIFTLTDINLKRVAKVSVLPKIDNTGTQANFSFNVAIEKRAIQLAPDEIEDRIKDLEDFIEDWEKISNDLGNTIKTFNTACLSTGVILTVKNFFENTEGKSIARNKVMRGEGGWTDKCREMVGEGKYGKSMNNCLLENAKEIDADVERYAKTIETINKNKITEENKYLQTKFLAENLDDKIIDPRGFGKEINTTDIQTIFNSRGENNTVLISQTRDLKAIEEALEKGGLSDVSRRALEIERYKILSEINENVKGSAALQSFAEETGLKQSQVIIGGAYSKDRVDIPISNDMAKVRDIKDQYNEIESKYEGFSAIPYKDDLGTGNYLLIVDKDGVVQKTYKYGEKIDGKTQLIPETEPNKFKLKFKLFDAKDYQNKFKNPEVKYFETEPYRGMPAQVPFDIQNGWYAAMKQTISGGGKIRTYDASGAISSFYLCNVGENGRAEFNSGVRDDICRGYNPGTGRIISSFDGLSKSEESNLVRKAISAINNAQSQHKSGVKTIKIGSQIIPVGNPEIGVPEMQCQDFMSPEDCHLLFNVCDPVICPSSRCNLGGTYHSSNVIQSGIIGSIALCLPNMKENIFVPICLTGLKAGIDNLLSVFTGYRDCLQTQLDTGETVGICDELHSIYLCEFFWREALPFAETIIPRIFESLLGQGGSRGGGEYLGVQSAWDTAQGSVDYMSNYYGRDITNAFKVKLTQEIGGAVCKNFISANYPSGGEVLDSLVEPASPPQYTANFNEIPFTTATVPATSQYKVFYHIYAGKESKAFYRVYLKSPSGTSLYQTSPTLDVASGFINKDGYASETKDFTAPTGYKELCINVNGQDNCGFKQVSTSFAIDYIEDKYLQEQSEQTDIKSQEECVSGSPSLYSLAQPNLQEGISEGINPALYDRGIIRICGTSNPGQGTDANLNSKDARWQKVGTCDGETAKIYCWLDTQSVKDVIAITSIEDEVLGDVSNNYVANLQAEGDYIDFGKELGIINKKDDTGKIDYITNTKIGKAFFNNQKAKLHLIRGNAYRNLAIKAYKLKIAQELAKAEKLRKEIEEEIDQRQIDAWGEQQQIEDLVSKKQTEKILKDLGINIDNLLKIKTCTDCGKGLLNVCGEEECKAVGRYNGINCEFKFVRIPSCQEKIVANEIDVQELIQEKIKNSEVVKNAQRCEDCNLDSDFDCNDELCAAIGEKIGKKCDIIIQGDTRVNSLIKDGLVGLCVDTDKLSSNEYTKQILEIKTRKQDIQSKIQKQPAEEVTSETSELLKELGWEDLESSLKNLRENFNFNIITSSEDGNIEEIFIYPKQDKINSYIILQKNNILFEGIGQSVLLFNKVVDKEELKEFLTNSQKTTCEISNLVTIKLEQDSFVIEFIEDYTIDIALEQVNNYIDLYGKDTKLFSSNKPGMKDFVTKLHTQKNRILTVNEFANLVGEGILNGEDDLEDLMELLEEKSEKKIIPEERISTIPDYTIDSALKKVNEYINFYKKDTKLFSSKIPDIKDFVVKLHTQKNPIITADEFADLVGEGILNGEDDLEDLLDLLEKKKLEQRAKQIPTTPEDFEFQDMASSDYTIQQALVEAGSMQRNGVSNERAKTFAQNLVAEGILKQEDIENIETINDVILALEDRSDFDEIYTERTSPTAEIEEEQSSLVIFNEKGKVEQLQQSTSSKTTLKYYDFSNNPRNIEIKKSAIITKKPIGSTSEIAGEEIQGSIIIEQTDPITKNIQKIEIPGPVVIQDGYIGEFSFEDIILEGLEGMIIIDEKEKVEEVKKDIKGPKKITYSAPTGEREIIIEKPIIITKKPTGESKIKVEEVEEVAEGSITIEYEDLEGLAGTTVFEGPVIIEDRGTFEEPLEEDVQPTIQEESTSIETITLDSAIATLKGFNEKELESEYDDNDNTKFIESLKGVVLNDEGYNWITTPGTLWGYKNNMGDLLELLLDKRQKRDADYTRRISESDLKENIKTRAKKIIDKEDEFTGYCTLQSNGEKGYFCAEFVTLTFDYLFGTGRSDFLGVHGNAWNFPENMAVLGGEKIYDYGESKEKFEDYDSLMVGDIFGFQMIDHIFRTSEFDDAAKKVGQEYTHVGIYLGKSGDDYLVVHKMGDTIAIDFLNKGFEDESDYGTPDQDNQDDKKGYLRGVKRIQVILRPNQERLHISVDDFIRKNEYDKIDYKFSSDNWADILSTKNLKEEFEPAFKDYSAIRWLAKNYNDIDRTHTTVPEDSTTIELVIPRNSALKYQSKTEIQPSNPQPSDKKLLSEDELELKVKNAIPIYVCGVISKGVAKEDQDKCLTGWANAIVNAMKKAEIPLDKKYAAIILSIIEGESSFTTDPIISGGFINIVKRKIESYKQPKKWAVEKFYNRHEKKLSEIKTDKQTEDFIDSLNRVEKYFVENLRPSSIGSMQIQVATAQKLTQQDYSDKEMRNILYTKIGGVEYGVLNFKKILEIYSDNFKKDITTKEIEFMFADYNAGQGSSKNAAFQNQLNIIMKTDLKEDGDLGKNTRKVLKQFLEKEGRDNLVDEGINTEIRNLVKEKSESSIDAQIPDITYGEIRFGRPMTVKDYVKNNLDRYNTYCNKLGC